MFQFNNAYTKPATAEIYETSIAAVEYGAVSAKVKKLQNTKQNTEHPEDKMGTENLDNW